MDTGTTKVWLLSQTRIFWQKNVFHRYSIVKDSDLILLDEPLANLDFKLREELREELPKLFEDRDWKTQYN